MVHHVMVKRFGVHLYQPRLVGFNLTLVCVARKSGRGLNSDVDQKKEIPGLPKNLDLCSVEVNSGQSDCICDNLP